MRAFRGLLILPWVVLVMLPQAASVQAAGGWQKAAPIGLAPGFVAFVAGTEGADGNAYMLRHCLHFACVPSSTEVYNGVSNKWAPAAATPYTYPKGGQLAFAAATGPQGKMYAIGGGHTDEAGTVYAGNLLISYSTTTNSWTQKASMPIARGQLAAAVGADSLIYALGGITGGACTGGPVSNNVVEAYNPTTNTWAVAASMLQARDSFGAALGPDNRLYAIAGEYQDTTCSGGTQTALNSVEAYSFTTHVWAGVAPFPVAGSIIGAVPGTDGRIYALSGAIALGVHVYPPPPTVLAAYDLARNAWTTLSAPPHGSAQTTAAVLAMTGVRMSTGATALVILDNICNTGKACTVKSFVYPT